MKCATMWRDTQFEYGNETNEPMKERAYGANNHLNCSYSGERKGEYEDLQALYSHMRKNSEMDPAMLDRMTGDIKIVHGHRNRMIRTMSQDVWMKAATGHSGQFLKRNVMLSLDENDRTSHLRNMGIEQKICAYHKESTPYNLVQVLTEIHLQNQRNGHFLVPVCRTDGGELSPKVTGDRDGQQWLLAFTSMEECCELSGYVAANLIESLLSLAESTDVQGIVINPWGKSFVMTKKLIELFLRAEDMKGAK